jgi:tetratricopeptide (TPR) repeat protein
MKKCILAILLLAADARAEPPPQPFDPAKELLRIAKMKQDDRLLSSFAEARGRSTPNLTEKEIFVIVEQVERVGSPDAAIRMLHDRAKRFPRDLDSRIALAKMYVRAGQTANAIPVWRDLANTFGLTPALALEYAHVLSTTGDHAGSLAVLAGLQNAAPADAIAYWRELAQIAWDQDDTKTALVAYRKVWTSDATPAGASSRLMQLLADAGYLDEAIVVARQALLRERNPQHLLFVARLQVKREDFAAAKRTLELADDQRVLVASTLEYWMLRADVLTRLGDRDGARDAHRVAYRLDPHAAGVRAALLFDSIERNDLRQLSTDLTEWLPDAERDREMWAATAIGLDRLGRSRDAIRFFLLQSKETPQDDLFRLEFADALGRVGEETIARNLRQRAYAGIRAQASAALEGKLDGLKLAEANVTLTEQYRGNEQSARLVRSLLASNKASSELEAIAIGFYLKEDNRDAARRRLARARLARLEVARSRRFALLLALADDDRVAIDQLVSSPNDLSDGERAVAYLRLERDDRAAAPIKTILDHADLGNTGDQPLAEVEVDAPTLRRELRSIDERTSTLLRGGGHLTYINALVIVGPALEGSYPHGEDRFSIAASGAQFDSLTSSAVRVSDFREAEVLGGWRRMGPRHVTEAHAGVDVQTEGPNANIPLPRAAASGAFRISRRVTAAFAATAQARVLDTSFLRVTGLRDSIAGDLVYEPIPRIFLIGNLTVLEDHTRDFDYLGFEAGGGLEAGYKIFQKTPELSIGARAGGYARDNRADVPEAYRSIVRPGEGRASLYSPPYQQGMVVLRISRGDFFERSRQELVSFPRYDCEVDAGYLVGIGIARTRPAPAGAVKCAASIRVPGHGYLSAAGEYIKGVTGLAEADNAAVSVTYTRFLR